MGGHALIVLDTHVLIWLDSGDNRLGRLALTTLDEAYENGEAAVSAITFWEVSMLATKRRIEYPTLVARWRDELLQSGIFELVVDGNIAVAANELDGLSADPADRFIVATAMTHGATLLTADRRLLAWSGDLARQDARL